jgi:hypothetical protein
MDFTIIVKQRRNKEMLPQEKAAREILANSTLADLFDEWKLTSEVNDPYIPTVRGWLMDEFERRNPEGFNAWLDTDAADDTLEEYITARA